jgi:hypothetical protein
MKKYILVAALAFAASNAMAERIVSGTNEKDRNSGGNKAEACKTAKEDALIKRTYDEQLAKYSPCECKQNEKGNWACTVDATLEKTR